MTQTVLFVCSMNVCRSPLMHQTFVEGLPAEERSKFDVSSRGVNAEKGNAICGESALLMHGTEEGRTFARSHLSRPIRPSDLISPQLVIVATRAERAILARYAPTLRPLTFTLREANLLGADSTSQSERASVARAEEARGAPLPLHGFAHLLHRRRGTITIPQPISRGRQRIDALDVPDDHLRRPHTHGTMLRALRAETEELVASMIRFSGHVSVP